MKALFAGGLTAVLFALAPALPALGATHVSSPSETLNEIHHINQKEIHLAHMALDKSSNPEVRSFADRMIKDHSSADRSTEAVARETHVHLKHFKLSPSETAEKDKLSKLSGPNFDLAYMNLMKSGHEEALDFLSSAKSASTNTKIQGLIADVEPVIKHHEELATNSVAVLEQAQHQYGGQAAPQ